MYACFDVQKRLKAWLDGELSPGDAGRVEAHVASCASCRAAADDFEAIAARVRSACAGPVPVFSGEAIAARARSADVEERRAVRVLQAICAAAAVVMIGAFLAITVTERPDMGFQASGVGQDDILELAISDPTLQDSF